MQRITLGQIEAQLELESFLHDQGYDVLEGLPLYADDDDENLIGYTFDVKDIEGDRSTIQFDILDESTFGMYETGEDGITYFINELEIVKGIRIKW